MVEIVREFDGAEHTFKIDDPILFELITPHKSAYALLQKFNAGVWSINDVALVISFALHGPTHSLAQMWSMTKRMLGLVSIHAAASDLRYQPHPDVVDVVKVAPGEYAPLATDILLEVVFGDGASVEADDE